MTAAVEMNQQAMMANAALLNKKIEMIEEKIKENEITSEIEKLFDLKSNEGFINKFFSATSEAEIQDAFKEQGVELSDEETKDFIQKTQSSLNTLMTATGELTDEELEQIAGGSFLDVLKDIAKTVIVGCVAAAVAAVGILTGVLTGGVGTVVFAGLTAMAVYGTGKLLNEW